MAIMLSLTPILLIGMLWVTGRCSTKLVNEVSVRVSASRETSAYTIPIGTDIGVVAAGMVQALIVDASNDIQNFCCPLLQFGRVCRFLGLPKIKHETAIIVWGQRRMEHIRWRYIRGIALRVLGSGTVSFSNLKMSNWSCVDCYRFPEVSKPDFDRLWKTRAILLQDGYSVAENDRAIYKDLLIYARPHRATLISGEHGINGDNDQCNDFYKKAWFLICLALYAVPKILETAAAFVIALLCFTFGLFIIEDEVPRQPNAKRAARFFWSGCGLIFGRPSVYLSRASLYGPVVLTVAFVA